MMNFNVSIIAADMTDPTCPVPGDVIYTGPADSVLIENGYYYRIIRIIDNPLVYGPYFMAITVTSDNSAAPFSWPVGSDAGDSCVAYNNFGSGWYDLVADYGFGYNPSYLWLTRGFSTDAPVLVETWTDVNGDYALALQPGDYIVHYDTTGWDSEVTAPFTLALDEVVLTTFSYVVPALSAVLWMTARIRSQALSLLWMMA
jgi:hypothetical protein